MTSSFNTVIGTQRDAPPDISKWNYAATEPDLAKSVNDEIDETSKIMRDHFALLASQETQYAKNKQAAHKELLDLAPKAAGLLISERNRRIAKLYQKDVIDYNELNDKYNARWRKENPNDPITKKINDLEAGLKEEDKVYKEDEKELNKGNAEVVTAEANAYNAGDHYAAKLLEGFGDDDRHQRVQLSQAYDISSEWIEYAKGTLEVEMPDGSFKTFNQAGNLDEMRTAYGAIISTFTADVISKRDFSPRLVRHLLIKPLFKDYQTAKKKYITENVEARKVIVQQQQSEDLLNAVGEAFTYGSDEVTVPESLSDEQVEEKSKEMGSVITDFIENYYGFHENSWVKARQQVFKIIEDAYIGNQITDAQVEAIGNSIIKGHDGGLHVLKDYWAKDYQTLKSKLDDKKRQAYQAKNLEDNIAMQRSDDKYKEQYLSDDFQDLSNDEKEEKIKTWQKETLRELGRSSSYLNGLLTQAEEVDSQWEENYLNELRHRKEVLGLTIDPSELRKFDRDGIWYPKAEELVDKKSMNQEEIKNANEFVRGETNAYTEENIGETDTGSPRWIAVKQQADAAFRRYYSDFISKPGNTKEGAYTYAMKEVQKDMANKLYDQYPVSNPDQELSLNIAKAQRLVGQNPTLIDSTEPWEGEEVHLKAALSYLGYGKIPKGMVDPTVYYAPLLKGLGKESSVSDLMEKRLVTTGLIKDGRVNPEKLINLDERILLNHKSTPGRTYKAFFQNPDGKETLLEYTDVGNLDELYTSLRFNSQISNSYTTPSLDWIQQVNIDPTLSEQYSDIVGDVPFYSQLDNLLPGVAEKLVKDTLLSEPVESPKVPGSSIYSEETGTGWKRSEKGNWEFYRNFEISRDDSPFSRDWIWDKYKKAWTPSTYIDPLKEPASKTFKYLEQVPGLLSNAFADIPKKLIQEPLESIGSRTTGSGVFEDGRELTVHELEQKNENSKE